MKLEEIKAGKEYWFYVDSCGDLDFRIYEETNKTKKIVTYISPASKYSIKTKDGCCYTANETFNNLEDLEKYLKKKAIFKNIRW